MIEVKKVQVDTSSQKFSAALEKLLEENLDVTITITGNSMFPLWRHQRDTVTLTKCDCTALKRGDIPLYKRKNGQYVLHRIMKVNQDSYDLCGDAQIRKEFNLECEQIIAVVKSFTRKGVFYDCNTQRIRLYTSLWVTLFPIRKYLLKAYRIFRRIF